MKFIAIGLRFRRGKAYLYSKQSDSSLLVKTRSREVAMSCSLRDEAQSASRLTMETSRCVIFVHQVRPCACARTCGGDRILQGREEGVQRCTTVARQGRQHLCSRFISANLELGNKAFHDSGNLPCARFDYLSIFELLRATGIFRLTEHT